MRGRRGTCGSRPQEGLPQSLENPGWYDRRSRQSTSNSAQLTLVQIAALESQLRESQLSAQVASDNSNSSSTSNSASDQTTLAPFVASTNDTSVISPPTDSICAFLSNGSEEGLAIDTNLINFPVDLNEDFLPMTTVPPLSTSVMTAPMLGYSSMSLPISDIMEAEL